MTLSKHASNLNLNGRAIGLLFVLFPFVGNYSGSDTQPFSVIYISAVFFLTVFQARISKAALCFFIVSLALIFSSTLVHISEISLSFFLSQVSIGIIFFGLFYLVSNRLLIIEPSIVIFAYFIYISVGVVQFYDPNFMSNAVSRPPEKVFDLVSSGRGVRSLAPEPAQLGATLINLNLLYALSRFAHPSEFSKARLFLVTLVMFLATVLVSQSAYVVIIYTMMIFFLALLMGKGVITSLIFILPLAVLASWGLLESREDLRIVVVFKALFDDPSWIVNQGAFARVVNIPLQALASVEFGAFGSGNSSEAVPVNLVIPFFELEVERFVGNRVLGGLFEIYLRMGVLGLPILGFVLILILVGIKRSIPYDVVGAWVGLSLMLTFVQYGSLSNPIGWLILVLFWERSNLYVSRQSIQGVARFRK